MKKNNITISFNPDVISEVHYYGRCLSHKEIKKMYKKMLKKAFPQKAKS